LVTVSDAVVVWFNPPLTPLTVSVYVCNLLDSGVLTVSVEVVEPGLGVKVIVLPDGWPVRLKATGPLNPLAGVMVTV